MSKEMKKRKIPVDKEEEEYLDKVAEAMVNNLNNKTKSKNTK